MTPPEIDRLLAEDDWLRRLAKSLVPDPDLAEDLVQDAWVAALESPEPARSARPWFRGVLRNLWRQEHRSDGRRVNRERRAARAEALPSAAELIEEVTLRREVADALLELDEPYRTTLYLRFFKDLSLKKIAAQTGVPLSTVHGHLQRGLEKMRIRLDKKHGGDRSAWALALVPLATPKAGLAATALGGVAMSTGIKVAASVVIAGGAIGIWIETRESQAVEPPASTEVAVATPAEIEPPQELDLSPTVPVSEEREAVAAQPEASVSEVEATPTGPAILKGRVIDPHQNPLAGIEVGLFHQREHGEERGEPRDRTFTDGGGRFRFEVADVEPDVVDMPLLWQKLHIGRPLVLDDDYPQILTGLLAVDDELLIVASPRRSFAGLVTDEGGVPIEGAKVAVRVHSSLTRVLGLSHFLAEADIEESHEKKGRWSTRTDATGRFELDGVVGGEYFFLDVTESGFPPAVVELPDHDDLDLVVVLERREDALAVSGFVVDDASNPVAEAKVSMGQEIALTDENGAFRLTWSLKEAGEVNRLARHHEGRDAPEIPVPAIAALKEGHRPVRRELAEEELAEPIILQLGSEPLTIQGTVVDEDGNPMRDVGVWVTNKTPFGRRTFQMGSSSGWSNLDVEDALNGFDAEATDAEGRFELGGLVDKEYELAAMDARTGVMGSGWKVDAGARGVELVLEQDPSSQPVAGRIVTVGGEPFPGLRISIHRVFREKTVSAPLSTDTMIMTGEDGRFAFPVLATEGTSLTIHGERTFFRTVPLADYDDFADIEIVQPILCEVQVDLGDRTDMADGFTVQDEDGRTLDMIEVHGNFMMRTEQAFLSEGKSGVLRVPETARTVVLTRGHEEVLRKRLSLDPDRRTTVEP